MTMEIGGYMELEHFTGKEYYPDLFRVNLGRTALAHLLQRLDCGRIFIPQYICDSVFLAAQQAGFEVVFYSIDENLCPLVAPEELQEKDYLYIVNYYGQLSPEEIRRWDREYHHRVILDNAQAFFERPIDDIHTIYTARKFLGLSDGAYIYSSACPQDENDLPQDRSAGRMKHILGRLEEDARTYYSEMLAVNHTFSDIPPLRMSRLTENLLRAVDYEFVAAKRSENYKTLEQLLPSQNPFTRRTPEVPFAYPYYHPDGVRLRKALAAQNIFVPTNWSYLISSMPEDSFEYEWSANILPLPIDQRYGEREMKMIADAIRAYDQENSL